MRFVAPVLIAIAVAGCGARRPAVAIQLPRPAAEQRDASGTRPPQVSLEAFMAKVRKLSEEARPQRQPATTLEASDPRLGAALAASVAAPSPETLRGVAIEYGRLGIADRSHEYLMRALAMDPRDAATYDALARLWRDWGFPHVGLSDAHRARYYAPASPVVHNTLGTLFQALGKRAEARRSYSRALQLDPNAAYALNNICYGWVLDGDSRKAVAACREALRLQPTLTAARNNLGLALAASGDTAGSRAAFEAAADSATALYNAGITLLARGQHAEALRSFSAAAQANPGLRVVQARVRQAEQLARTGAEE